MGGGTVVGVGVDYQDSKGQAPHAWRSGWRGHRQWELPLATCAPGMGLGSGCSRVPVDNGWLECLDPVLKVEGEHNK